MFSQSDVWAFGATVNEGNSQTTGNPYAAHFDGRRWTVTKLSGDAGITGVSAAHFNGHRWAVTRVPAGGGEITAASVVSPTDIWAVTGPIGEIQGVGLYGGASKWKVLHWNGHRWLAPPQPRHLPSFSDLTGVTAGVRGQVWISGFNAAGVGRMVQFTDHLTGAGWHIPVDLPGSKVPVNGTPDLPEPSLAPDGHGGLWALSETVGLTSAPVLWHETAGKWSKPIRPGFGAGAALMELAAVPGTRSVWAAGEVGAVPAAAEGLIAIDGPTPR